MLSRGMAHRGKPARSSEATTDERPKQKSQSEFPRPCRSKAKGPIPPRARDRRELREPSLSKALTSAQKEVHEENRIRMPRSGARETVTRLESQYKPRSKY